MRPWVLVTADGPQLRDPLVAVRALAAGGYRPAVALSADSSLATASRHCERVIRVPRPTDPGYADVIEAAVARDGYVAVLPASEAGLLGLGRGVPELADKATLHALAARVGIPAPPTRTYDAPAAVLADRDAFDYPLIVKPVVHTDNARRVDRPDGLAAALPADGAVMVQPFLRAPMRSLNGIAWRGRLVATVHERWLRIWPADAGVASSAVTEPPDLDLEDRMAKLLDGYEGIFNAQFIGPYLIDMNLRLSTTLPLAVAAGANVASLWCDLQRGRTIDEPVRARAGVFFRWIEGDARALAVAVRRGEMRAADAARALLPRRGAVHATESLHDPRPMLRRAWYLGRRAAGMPR